MRPHLSVSIPDCLSRLKDERKSKVCDACRHVRLDEDVFALEISVSDGRFHFLEKYQ